MRLALWKKAGQKDIKKDDFSKDRLLSDGVTVRKPVEKFEADLRNRIAGLFAVFAYKYYSRERHALNNILNIGGMTVEYAPKPSWQSELSFLRDAIRGIPDTRQDTVGAALFLHCWQGFMKTLASNKMNSSTLREPIEEQIKRVMEDVDSESFVRPPSKLHNPDTTETSATFLYKRIMEHFDALYEIHGQNVKKDERRGLAVYDFSWGIQNEKIRRIENETANAIGVEIAKTLGERNPETLESLGVLTRVLVEKVSEAAMASVVEDRGVQLYLYPM